MSVPCWFAPFSSTRRASGKDQRRDMFDTIFGLPVHPLLVHATVVIVPAAVLAVALAAAWRPFRLWAGYLPLLLSVAGLVLVPLSTSSGESLERRVAQTA